MKYLVLIIILISLLYFSFSFSSNTKEFFFAEDITIDGVLFKDLREQTDNITIKWKMEFDGEEYNKIIIKPGQKVTWSIKESSSNNHKLIWIGDNKKNEFDWRDNDINTTYYIGNNFKDFGIHQ